MATSIEPRPVDLVLPINELASVLVRHYGLHEGLYEIVFEMQVGIGAVGPDPTNLLPGVAVGISKLGLRKVEETKPNVVDAALVNPLPAATKKARTSALPRAVAATKRKS